MCCIYFGFNREGEDLALPASVAERALDITFGNRPPTADAGSDKITYRGLEVELVGSGTDPDGDTLTYRWEQLDLDELGVVPINPVTINNADQADAIFTAPDEIGALSFKLTVTDSHGASHSDTVTVTVANRDPIALAGPDKLITAGHKVTLEGSVSDLDPDDRASVTHTWTQHGNNPATVTLAEVEGRPAQRTFTPSTTGDYTFTLTATDPYGLTASDTVKVKVLESSKSIIPTNVTALPGDRSVDISWTRVSIATGYELQVGVAEDGGEIGYASYTTTALTYRVANLVHSTRYHYRVRATYNGYVGPWSATGSVVTLPPSRLTFAPNAGPGPAPREATPPPTPTGSQWDLRYDGGKIQVRIKDLPDVAPEISRARVYLEAGAPPDVTVVAKPVGTALNRWTTALSSSDSQWRTGSWAVRIRYENLVGSSGYSAAKSVIVPAALPTTTPTPDPTPTKPTVAPTGVTATATANSVTVRWAGVNGATGYDMQLGVIEEGGEIGYKGYSVAGLR